MQPRWSSAPNRRVRPVRVAPPRAEGLEERVVCSGVPTLEGVAAGPLPVRAEAQGPRARYLDVTRLANVPYTTTGTSTQLLDVYRPGGTPPPGGWPVVMAIHGGGWRRFSKEQYAAKVAPVLVARGYAVVAPNYTLSYPGAPSWPAPLVELRQAVRWVRANASGLNLDGSKIAAMGESAGGHLALLLGTDPAGDDTKIQAVVDFFGPTDLASLRLQSPGARPAVDQLLGPGAYDPATLADASPVSHVDPTDPPVLMIQGMADGLVPFSQSREMAVALTAAKVRNTLILIPGVGHGFGFRTGGRTILPAVLGFLDRSLGVAPVSGSSANP
ncbi:MAG: alpha/beta hydrolase [Isosphaeraceae bacterium]